MSYRGTKVPIALGVDGLYGTRKIPITGLLRGRNITLENNQIEKWGGATDQNADALASDIIAGIDWWPDESTQRAIVMLDNGAILRDAGTWAFGTTVLASGTLTVATRPPHLVAGGGEAPGSARKLFILTGQNSPRVGSGDFITTTAIATPAADWAGTRQPTWAGVHEGRMFMLLEHTVYWSTATDHENFTGAGSGSLPVYPGEGLRLVLGVSIRKMLVLFKFPRGIYILDTSAASPSNWRVDPQSRAVGAAGPYGGIAIPNDVLFLDRELNFHLLSATAVERDATSSNISAPKLGLLTREQFDPSRAPWAQLAWYSDKSMALAGLSALGAAVNNRIILVDFNNPPVGPRFAYSDRDTPQSLWMREVSGVNRPHIGTDDGFVQRLDTPTRSKNGVGYTGQFQIDHTDLGDLIPEWAGKRKRFDFLEFELEGVGNYNLSVNIYINGVLRTTTPLAFSMAGAGVPLGSFVLGTDRLGEVTPVIVKRRLRWRGTRISFEGSNAGAAQDFRIRKAFVSGRLAE